MSNSYENLSPANRLIAHVSNRPRWAVYGATLLAVLFGWIWIVFLTAGASQYSSTTQLGPGMGALAPLLDRISSAAQNSTALQTLLRLCSPQFTSNSDLASFATLFVMWMSMSVAMMLPSAAPMLRTYADIADVARSKGEDTVPVWILAAGYLISWMIFSLIASLVQALFIQFGVMQNPLGPVHGLIGGAILMGAGAYQLSSLKDACLEKCRNPFTTLFAQWSTEKVQILRLGMQQGMFCIGCCWALMMVMFVVGTMNLAWMGLFTLFAILEKSAQGKAASQITGIILLGWGAILSLISTAGL